MVKLLLKLPIQANGQTDMAQLEGDLGCNIKPSDTPFGKDDDSNACSRCRENLSGRKIVGIDNEGKVWYQFHPECFEDGTVLADQLAAEIAKLTASS